MDEYSVTWEDTVEPHTLFAGSVAIRSDRLLLQHRSADDGPVLEFVPLGEVSAVERVHADERLDASPSLRVDLRYGRSLLLAGVVGAGVHLELLDALTTAVSGA